MLFSQFLLHQYYLLPGLLDPWFNYTLSVMEQILGLVFINSSSYFTTLHIDQEELPWPIQSKGF